MPFIERQKIAVPVDLKVKLEPDVYTDLVKYLEFMKPSTPNFVATEVFRKVMRQDKEFQKYLADAKGNGNKTAAAAAKA